MSKIQSILFNRNHWTIRTIVDMLYENEFVPIKQAHLTKNYYKVRLMNPSKDKKYRTKKINEGLKFIIEL